VKSPISSKTTKILLDGLRLQECSVRPTTNGWHILFPNGAGTSLHRTLSDWRALKNFRSIVRQQGLVWPLDKEEFSQLAQKSRRGVQQA
jgi:hypothetical protein